MLFVKGVRNPDATAAIHSDPLHQVLSIDLQHIINKAVLYPSLQMLRGYRLLLRYLLVSRHRSYLSRTGTMWFGSETAPHR